MAALPKKKWEDFARALADGKSQEDAYIAAGYSAKGASSSANKLYQGNPRISQRVEEIRAIREKDAVVVREKVAEQAAFDNAKIIATLEEIVGRCMQYEPVIDKEGKPVVVQLGDGTMAAGYFFDPKGATNALKLLGLERPKPMFVQRHEVKRSLADEMSPELARRLREKLLAMTMPPASPGLTHIRREPVTIDAKPECPATDGRPEVAGGALAGGAKDAAGGSQ